MSYFKMTEGVLVGKLRAAKYKEDNYQGKITEKIELDGDWEGLEPDQRKVDVSLKGCESRLIDSGFLTLYEDGTYGVDQDRRIAIQRSGTGTSTRWEIGEANEDETTTIEVGGGGRRGPSRPSRPAQARQSEPRSAPARQAPQARPAQSPPVSRADIPREDPTVTRRRVVATLEEAFRYAEGIWKGRESSPEALQATAATLLIQWDRAGVPLLADPQAPPPLSDQRKAELKGLRDAAKKLGYDDSWFNESVRRHGNLFALTDAEAVAAITDIVGVLTKREAALRAEEAAKAKPAQTLPAAPVDDEIPF